MLAEKRVARVDQIGKKEIKSGVRRLFEALGTAGPGRDAAIAAVLKKNSVYTNYVRSLVSNGIDVAKNHRGYLDSAITDATTVAITPAAGAGAGGAPGRLNPGLSTARLGGKIALFRDGAAAEGNLLTLDIDRKKGGMILDLTARRSTSLSPFVPRRGVSRSSVRQLRCVL